MAVSSDTLKILPGIDPAIDHVAAAAVPSSSFLTRAWFAAAAGKADCRTIVQKNAAGEPVIALPIGRSGRLLRQVPGSYWPFRSFPVAQSATVADMAALLRAPAARQALGRIWRLGPIFENDPALLLLRQAAARSGWMVVDRQIAISYLLDLKAHAAEGWPRESSVKKNRSREKGLAREGEVVLQSVRGGDWTPAVFADLAAIEAKSWQGESSDPKFMPGPHAGVWQALAADPVFAERMHAKILYVNGAPISFIFDLDAGSFMYGIANSYDPAFHRHSPSRYLFFHDLVDAIGRGMEAVDFGAGDDGYKQSMGANPASRIVDCVVMRKGWQLPLSLVAGKLWQRSGQG